jgi:hypothetical protein
MGFTVIVDNIGVVTVNVIGELTTPDSVAVILTVPMAMPFAKPTDDIVALIALELDQVTCEVISVFVPSEYCPLAVNCWVRPPAKLAGEGGVILMEDNFNVDVEVPIVLDEEIIFTLLAMLTELVVPKLIMKLRLPILAVLEAAKNISSWYTLGPELPETILIGPLLVKVIPVFWAFAEALAVTVIV